MQTDYTPQITEEMRSRYIARRTTDLALLEAALASEDYETLLKIAHQIKGNAATFNFTALEKAALALESSAQRKSQAEIHLALNDFRDWLKSQS